MGRMHEYVATGMHRMRGWIYPFEPKILRLRREFYALETCLQAGASNRSSMAAFPDIWDWLCSLPRLSKWEGSVMSMELCSSEDNTKSLLLVAERSAGSDCAGLVTFSFVLGGDWPLDLRKTLWVSNPCSFGRSEESMETRTLPLVLHLMEDILKRAPKLGSKSFATEYALQDRHVGPALVNSERFKEICNFAFLCRFFWLCACEAPCEVGSLYFEMVGWKLEINCKGILRVFVLSIGADMEEHFMRSLGYMFTKWMCLRSLISKFGAREEGSSFEPFTYTYATASGGVWKVRGYAPILAMQNTETHPSNPKLYQLPDTDDSLLQYVLSHQQLEVTIQLHCSVYKSEESEWIEVEIGIDNVRCDVSQLAFSKTNGVSEERHFPSRISLTVGPEEGWNVLAMSLNKSSDNPRREVGTQKMLKGSLGEPKFPILEASAIAGSATKVSSWGFEQYGEGNKGSFEWILYDSVNGKEVASSKPSKSVLMESRGWFRDRYSKANRPFTKRGGVVFASEVYGQSIRWRLKKDLQGQTLNWNVRGCVWLSYWPNTYKTSYCETRYVEFLEQFHLSL